MLSTRSKRIEIPEYSWKGDVLAYRTCPYQYRLNNRGALPPSSPLQLYWGELIHGAMAEAYYRWKDEGKRQFPWPDEDIIEVVMRVAGRLEAQGLYPKPGTICRHQSRGPRDGCPDEGHPHPLLANRRAKAAINTLGPHLFPLIEGSEVRLKGQELMPNYDPATSRSKYFSITGVADVISSVNLFQAPPGNLLLKSLNQNTLISEKMRHEQEFEVIIEYKGTMRPAIGGERWNDYRNQVLTYAWLRSKQLKARPIISGMLMFLNELEPSNEEFAQLVEESKLGKTDMPLRSTDVRCQLDGSNISANVSRLLREERSLLLVPTDPQSVQGALAYTKDIVSRIESSVLRETGGMNIQACWEPQSQEYRTCMICDARTYCTNPNLPKGRKGYEPTVP